MPGYCVAGTVGAKVIGGMKQIEMDGKMVWIYLACLFFFLKTVL